MEKTIEYRHVGGDDKRFAGLCRELDAWLLEAVGAEDLAPYEELNQAVGVEDAFLAFDGEEAVGCVCPVSYTHLDVYKRQGYFTRRILFPFTR